MWNQTNQKAKAQKRKENGQLRFKPRGSGNPPQ